MVSRLKIFETTLLLKKIIYMEFILIITMLYYQNTTVELI
jgi:hypothetical protein